MLQSVAGTLIRVCESTLSADEALSSTLLSSSPPWANPLSMTTGHFSPPFRHCSVGGFQLLSHCINGNGIWIPLLVLAQFQRPH